MNLASFDRESLDRVSSNSATQEECIITSAPILTHCFLSFRANFVKSLIHNIACLQLMIEKWRDILDNRGETGTVLTLTDLSKVFDCINNNLLIY